MKVELTKAVAGKSLRAIRDFFRKTNRLNLHTASRYLQMSMPEARAFLLELVRAGYVELDTTSTERTSESEYEVTDLGQRLKNAKALRRIGRDKAHEIVCRLKARVTQINANDDYVYRVKELRVFGSYVDGSADLGDVDVAVELEVRPQYAGDIVGASRNRARAAGKQVKSFMDEIAYGEREVRGALKGVSRHLSLHSMDDLRGINARSEVLFPGGAGD
jgi:predicted nucleotidyltransferase